MKALRCKLYGASSMVPGLWCKLCGESSVVQALWCKLCGASSKVWKPISLDSASRIPRPAADR